MKKLISIVLSLLTFFSAICHVFAAGEDTYYTLDGFTATVNRVTKVLTISGEGKMADYSFYDRAVWYNIRDDFETIVIDEGVTKIGNYAFYGLITVKSVSFPSTLEYIGEYAFCGCKNTESFVVPNSVTYIGKYAFSECTNIYSVVLPEKLDKISEGILFRSNYLKKLQLPKSCPVIEAKAFESCAYLEFVELPSDVEYIGDYAFGRQVALKSLSLPETLKYIGDYAFSMIKEKDLVIPKSVEHIGYNAFYSLPWFTSMPDGVNTVNGITLTHKGTPSGDTVTIPHGTVKISVKTCTGLSCITQAVIPNTVEIIEEKAFYNMPSLQNVIIPDSVVSIGDKAFGYLINEDENEFCAPEFTVFGHAGLEGERYAEENGFDFVCLHEEETYIRENCSENETVHVLCKWCKEELYSVNLTAAEHTFSEIKTVSPTCTSDGSTSRKCTLCGYVQILSETKAFGHTPAGSFELDSLPSCTEAGSISKKCTVCGERCDIRKIEPTGHIPGDYETETAATCTVHGVEVLRCTVCEAVIDTREIPAADHIPCCDWEIIKKPAPGIYGFRIKSCVVCGTVTEYEDYTEEFELGDINGDLRINIKDLSLLKKMLTEGISTDFFPTSADVNEDGRIKVNDITFFKTNLFT